MMDSSIFNRSRSFHPKRLAVYRLFGRRKASGHSVKTHRKLGQEKAWGGVMKVHLAGRKIG